MKKVLLIVGMVLFATPGISQTIYKGLETGMSSKEAKKEFRANKDQYTNVDIGNGFLYRIYQQNFKYTDDGLVSILFSPKGAAMGLSYDNAVSYLEHTNQFFEKLGYEEFFRPEYWNAPLNFNSKYGVLLSNPEKTTMAHIYPTNYELYGKTVYQVQLHLYNYNQFMEWYNQDQRIQEEKRETSGF